jgi:hypothetical protein
MDVTGGTFVGSTILTVIVLVVMWVVVLVPMFTHRNEDNVGFTGAVRVLRRRNAPAPHSSHLTDSVDEPELSEQDSAPDVVQRPMATTRAQMLARRRRTLGTIVMLAIMTALLAVGWRPRIWVVHAGLDMLLIGYLWWLRQEARREKARRARRAARSARGEGVARTVARNVPADVVEEQPTDEPPVDDGRWEPRPVPRPTYLDAPVHHAPAQEVAAYEVVALDDQDPDLYEFDDYPTAEIEVPPRAVNG